MSYGRTRKQAKLDEENTFDDIIKRGPSESAKRQMQHEAYQSIEVMDYIRKYIREVVPVDKEQIKRRMRKRKNICGHIRESVKSRESGIGRK